MHFFAFVSYLLSNFLQPAPQRPLEAPSFEDHCCRGHDEVTKEKNPTAVGLAHLALIGRLRLLHHVPVGEGGDGRGVSGLLGATGAVDLGEDQLLQACRGRQRAT